jgi:CheY-like chemotaxis protein
MEKLKVLVVDDDPLLARSNCRILRQEFNTVAVLGYTQAVAALKAEQFDAVLTDYDMNRDGNGLDVARTCAALNVPCVLYSANNNVDYTPRLYKPSANELIVAALKEAVRSKDARPKSEGPQATLSP